MAGANLRVRRRAKVFREETESETKERHLTCPPNVCDSQWLSKSLQSLRSSLLLDVFRLRNRKSSSMDDTGENILPCSKRVDDRLHERVGKQTNSNFATEFAIAFKLRFAVPLIL